MTLKIEKECDGRCTTIRLIGRIRVGHLEELRAQINEGAPTVVLDLSEVALVDLDVVRFLGDCQAQGTQLLHCAPYIYEWIDKERQATSR
jgi:anti-anti-sigma regulatory factor